MAANSPIRHPPTIPPDPSFFAPPSGQPARPRIIRANPQQIPARPGAQIAQLVEQRIENPRVGGSIPSLGTNTFKHLRENL